MATQQLKVSELIERLRQYPPDASVEVEGCDCVENAVDVDHDSVTNTVMICRNFVDRTPTKSQEDSPNTGPPSKRWGS